MAVKPAHLVERAAERLLHLGLLNGSAMPPPAAGADVVSPELPDCPSHEAEWTPTRSIIGMALLERAGMFDWSRGRSRILEEFRLAQRQLLRVASRPTAAGIANLVMVTSARPGEGKSFVSLNLACSIALQGDRDVLLIDCDPSRQSISHTLGLVQAPGVLDLAANPRLAAEDIILRTEVKNLSVLPVGREQTRSSELFASRDMTYLVQQLGRRDGNRVVLLDAAPCLSTSDPAALAPVVGQILMVVQAERTQREEVESALELLQACPSIMLVLNRAHPWNRHTFGGYSSDHSS